MVVGSSTGAITTEGYIWTDQTGMQTFANEVLVQGISADGTVVVGAAKNAVTGFLEPFQYTDSSGLQLLGLPTSEIASFNTFAQDVSGDGSVVVGLTSFGTSDRAFRWTGLNGFEDLGDLAGGTGSSNAIGVSEDGGVIVGQASGNGEKAFRWTSADGMSDLGDLSGGAVSAVATGISADGTVIVGTSESALGVETFRWTKETGMVGLGFFQGINSRDFPIATTRSGEAIVGQTDILNSLPIVSQAMLWTDQFGTESLQETLVSRFDLQSELDGWHLTSANDISADGRSIVGHGINPDGNREAWLVRLDQPIFVPEPSGVLLSFLAFSASVFFMEKRTALSFS